MTNRLKRLELTWIGKEERPRSSIRTREAHRGRAVAREAVRDHRIPGTWNVYQGTIKAARTTSASAAEIIALVKRVV